MPNALPQIRFVNHRMNREEQQAYQEYRENHDQCDMDFVLLVTGGYKFSLSYDEKYHAFTASFTCRAQGHANEGMCMSAKSDDAWDAMRMITFKVAVLFSKRTWDSIDQPSFWG